MSREGQKWVFLGNAGAITLVLVTYFGLSLSSRALSYRPDSISAPIVSAVHVQGPASGLPVRLEISKLKVDAAIEDVGVTAAGNMDVPTNIADAGWYEYGPHPGSTGSAVIAGHLDGPKGQPGVFSKLGKLQPGDSLATTDGAGHTTTFIVREIRTYSQDAYSRDIFAIASGAHLNLITCTGAWDKTHRRFQQRLVVFADEV
jgi:sortase A